MGKIIQFPNNYQFYTLRQNQEMLTQLKGMHDKALGAAQALRESLESNAAFFDDDTLWEHP